MRERGRNIVRITKRARKKIRKIVTLFTRKKVYSITDNRFCKKKEEERH